MRSVLILGARSPVALDHARRFSAQGWRVVVGDSVSCRITRWSRAVHAAEVLPSARYDLRGYAAALVRVITAHRIDLVLPTCEEVFYLARCRSALPREVRVLVDTFDTLAELHSKWRFLQAARGCGAVIPDSCVVSRIEEAQTWAAGRPVVLKPEFSRFGVHVRRYPEGIPADAEPLSLGARWVAQAYCHGRELCSYSVVDRGRVMAHVTYRPVHRIGGSSGYAFEACHAPAVESFVRALAAKLSFTGQMSFDWIESPSGDCQVLECNPRAVSGVHLFAADDALPDALMGERDACVYPTAPGMRMIGAVMAAAAVVPSLRACSLREWWHDFRGARDVIAVPGDRRPLLGGLLDLASYARLAASQRCTMRQASTCDTEWDGQELEAL